MSEKTLDTKAAKLRYGWTTGACACGGAKAAFLAMITGTFPKTIEITLPKGQTPTFDIAFQERLDDSFACGIIKDAGDDPDVTHGALIIAKVTKGKQGSGITYRAGVGVGVVTKKGLPLFVGEPAINPKPREIIEQELKSLAKAHNVPCDLLVEISVPEGEAMAQKTMNPRLGIVGGISILGTTGIVVPYSCSAWIHSIHRGVDVARAEGFDHLYAAVGKTSEDYLLKTYSMNESALIDMGDFVGGLIKYLKHHPVARLTLAGGFAKLSKLAFGAPDLHSKRSHVDFKKLAKVYKGLDDGAQKPLLDEILTANTGLEVLQIAQRENCALGDEIARLCVIELQRRLGETKIVLDVACVDRKGVLVGAHSSAG